MNGVGLYALVELDRGCVTVRLYPRRTGLLSRDEIAAQAVLNAQRITTAEMLATTLEQLASLVPIYCAGCGAPVDVPALVAHIRKGAVLS